MSKKQKKKKGWPIWAKTLIVVLILTIGTTGGMFGYSFSQYYTLVAQAAETSHKQLTFWQKAGLSASGAWNWTLGHLGNKAAAKKEKQIRKTLVNQKRANRKYATSQIATADEAFSSLTKAQQKKVLKEYGYNNFIDKNSGRFTGVTSESEANELINAMTKALGKNNKTVQKINRSSIKAKRTQQTHNTGNKTTSQNDTLDAAQKEYEEIWNAYSGLSAKKKAAIAKAMKKKGYGSIKHYSLNSQKSLNSKENKDVKKYYEALYNASSKYLTTKEKSKIKKLAGNTDDTIGAHAAAQADEPTSFAGKIGKALINAFWSSSIGKWLKSNSAGSAIFAGETTPAKVSSALKSNRYQSIYGNKTYTTMAQVANNLLPAMILAGLALLVLFIIINATRMGVGTITDPVRSRLQWYHSMIDLAISAIGIACYAALINMIVDLNNGILVAFAKFMGSLTPLGSSKSVFSSAITLGFDSNVATALTKGTILGSGFAGVIFCIIYLIAYIGLAVYIKYYYFVRAITFTILIAIGPIFIALWSLDWAKRRTFAWLQDFAGTVFIQSIHALTLTFMAMFMAWNNSRFLAAVGSKNHVSAFNGMVVGFIIMIVFQPVAKSLADLFGISTNMLGNIHSSTSRVMAASGAIAAGAALSSAKVLGNAVGGTARATGAALKAGKAAGKAGADVAALKAARGNAFRKSMKDNHVLGKAGAGVNGIVGSSIGQLAGLAAGAGAGSSLAALYLSGKGGEVGTRAAQLTNKGLNHLGLRLTKGRKLKKEAAAQSQQMRDNAAQGVNSKVDAGLAKTEEANLEGAKLMEDKNNGPDDVAAQFKDELKASAKALEDDPQNQKLMDEFKSKKELLAAGRDTSKAKNELYADEDAMNAIARQHAATKTGDKYVDAKDLMKATNEALNDNDKKKLNAGIKDNQANEVQKSAALAGAVTSSPIKKQEIADMDLAKARRKAKAEYISKFGGETTKDMPKAQAKALEQVTADQALKHNCKNKDGSANVSEWLNSTQYQNGLKGAMKTAGLEAAKQSDGAILSMDKPQNMEEFGNSKIDADKFKRDMHNKLEAKGFDQATIDRFDKAIDGVKAASGQDLVTTSMIPGSSTPVKSINKELYDTLADQQAKQLNYQYPDGDEGAKFTAADFEAMNDQAYNPSAVMGSEDAFNLQDFKNYLDQNDNFGDIAERNLKAEQYRRDAWTDAAADQAGDGANFAMPSKFGFGSDATPHGEDIFSSNFDETSLNPQVARSIASYDRSHPIGNNAPGIGTEIARMQASAESNGLSNIPDDSFQMVTTNNGSYVQAKDPENGWVQIGQFGPGDLSLRNGESIIQDLAYNSDTNTIGPKLDKNSRALEPYSISNGVRIPRSYSNGRPDLGTMLNSFGSNGPATRTDLSDYTKINTSGRAQALADAGTLSVDKLTAGTNGYDDFKYYSDGTKQTIIGHRKDAPEGSYENLVPNYSFGSLMPSAMTGVQYSVDLTPTDNGLGVSSTPNINVYSHNGQLTDQQRNSYLGRIHNALDGAKGRSDFNSRLSDIIPQTEEVPANRLAKYSANKDINDLSITNGSAPVGV